MPVPKCYSTFSNACRAPANAFPNGLALAELLQMRSRTVWRLQSSCKCIPERFGACRTPANAFPNGLALAELLQMHSRMVWRLQNSCKCIPEWFGACRAPANAFPNGLALTELLHACPPLHWTSSTIFLIVDERPNPRFVFIFPCIKIQYFSVGSHVIF